MQKGKASSYYNQKNSERSGGTWASKQSQAFLRSVITDNNFVNTLITQLNIVFEIRNATDRRIYNTVWSIIQDIHDVLGAADPPKEWKDCFLSHWRTFLAERQALLTSKRNEISVFASRSVGAPSSDDSFEFFQTPFQFGE